MAMKVGDRVRFLNTTGGGVVVGFLGKDLANVLEDDGFEVPVLIKECVVVESVAEKKTVSEKPQKEVFLSTPKEVTTSFSETHDGNQMTIALAFVPQDMKNLSSNLLFDFYFVNDSNYCLFYTISSLVKDQAQLLNSGQVGVNAVSFLSEVSKEQLNDFEKLNVQFVAYKTDKLYDIKPAISFTVKLKTVNFFKLHSFVESDYFEEPAMIVPVMQKDRLETPIQINADDFNRLLIEKEKKEVKPESKKTEQNGVLEIDLHIHELLDDVSGLSAADLLEFQLKQFDETMLKYKNKKGQRIVFIHGKGNGVLRNEVLKILKKKYTSCRYQDASFKEYGFGATMVTIK